MAEALQSISKDQSDASSPSEMRALSHKIEALQSASQKVEAGPQLKRRPQIQPPFEMRARLRLPEGRLASTGATGERSRFFSHHAVCISERHSIPWLSRAVSATSLAVSFYVLLRAEGIVTASGVISILAAHEAGHLLAARRLRIPALWPLFLPYLGACVLLLGRTKDARDQAWIGISGPIAGVAATLLFHVIAVQIESSVLLGVAAWGYAIHLLNLLPAGNLDGGHIAGFIARWLWLPGAASVGLCVFFVGALPWYGRIVFALILISATVRATTVVLDWTGVKPLPEGPPHSLVSKLVLWILYACLVFACLAGFIASALHRMRPPTHSAHATERGPYFAMPTGLEALPL